MSNIGAMRCVSGGGGVSPSSDNSRRKNRAVCSYLFFPVCMCYCMRCVCVYVHISVFACVVPSAAEKDPAVAQ